MKIYSRSQWNFFGIFSAPLETYQSKSSFIFTQGKRIAMKSFINSENSSTCRFNQMQRLSAYLQHSFSLCHFLFNYSVMVSSLFCQTLCVNETESWKSAPKKKEKLFARSFQGYVNLHAPISANILRSERLIRSESLKGFALVMQRVDEEEEARNVSQSIESAHGDYLQFYPVTGGHGTRFLTTLLLSSTWLVHQLVCFTFEWLFFEDSPKQRSSPTQSRLDIC